MSFFSYIFIGGYMKRLLFCLMVFVLLLPVKIKAFDTSATSAILMDMDSGRILYSKDIHNIRTVASISKIMTCIVAVESGKLDEIVTIGDEILPAYGSGIYIKQGEQLKLIDLLYGLMLRSGNDAALAIANFVGGDVDNFVNLMNKKAQEIGMKNSTFNNPSGLDQDKGNYSTAYDMAILTSYAMKNDIYKKIVGTKKYTLTTNMNTYVWYNKNKLLNSYKYTTGGKTGFTDKARRTLVTTASCDNLNLVVVTLNDGNDFADHKNLYEEAFQNYFSYKILEAGEINIYDENYYTDFSLNIKESFSYPLMKSEKNNLYLKIELSRNESVKDGDMVGNVHVMQNDAVLFTTGVFVKSKIGENTNLKWYQKIAKWWKNLW